MAGQPVRQRIVVPFTGHVIGEGFNSDTVERVGTGLDVAQVREDPTAPGQSAVFKFQMLTSQASLEKALNIGAEVEARYGLFSGGAKFDFAESSALNTTSTYIVASCVVVNALRFGSGFTPNASAAPLVQAGSTDEFKAAFGDRFTQALHTGGEFHALVRVTSSKSEHQRRISASLHAELNGLAGGSFQGSLSTAQSDTSSHTEVNIQIHQTGGVGAQIQIPGTEADKIRDHMNRFAEAAHSNAAAFEAELATYDILALPFPRPEELEDRRRVLEDCLARRQTYLSIISDLTYAQSEDAPLIFENLPPAGELVALQNDFRRILNALMSHARQISSGAIPPSFFVAEDEPPLPRFKRRTTGSFAVWWARRKANDPTLLQDEKLLIERIADAAGPALTVPVDEATPETMERAADQIEELGLGSRSGEPPLRSAAALPSMIDAPLRKVFARGTELEDLTGLEEQSRLEFLMLELGPLRDIQGLVGAAGLEQLFVRGSEISDLSPIRALTALEVLCVAGNGIQTLDPLRELRALRVVSLAHLDPFTALLMDNPIADARALADLPRLATPLCSADRLRIEVFDRTGAATAAGIATRTGNTNRFRFAPDGGGTEEQIVLMGMLEWSDLNLFPNPVVATALHFANGDTGLACSRPDDRSATLPAAELNAALAGGVAPPEIGLVVTSPQDDERDVPHLVLEVTPA
ncbi:MAG TPA: hypothetical protein VF520_03300 [Thermoleophilaceae bacterium]|jgi:hypothetical protein